MNKHTQAVLLVFLTAAACADDLIVKPIDEQRLTYDFSPNNYKNSPSNYSNSLSNYTNSNSNYSNSESNYKNSPSNFTNGSGGSNRLLYRDKDGNYRYIGYVVRGRVTNFFGVSGKRVFYNPSGTNAVFNAEGGEFVGALGVIAGDNSLGLIADGSRRLFAEGQGSAQISVAPNAAVRATAKPPEQAYYVDRADNFDRFVINGNKYKAQTICTAVSQGDRVIFLEGSALGACAVATVKSVNSGEVCNLWCE